MTNFFVDPAIISVLLGSVLPILVGLVTKEVAARGLQAAILALLSGATGVLAGAQSTGGVISRTTILYAFVAWVVAVATHYGFWKPTGASDAVQQKTSDIGLG